MDVSRSDIDFSVADNPVRPTECIEKLCSLAKDNGERFIMKSKQRLIQTVPPDPSYVWFFLDGDFHISRRSNGLILYAGKAPAIFGLWDLFQYNGEIALVAETACSGITMPTEHFKSLLDISHGWPLVAEYIMYSFHLMAIRDKYLIATSSYNIVCYYLQEIMRYPPYRRKLINIQRYIHERTRLSRSGVLQIVAELRNKGYINVENGALINMKSIPSLD